MSKKVNIPNVPNFTKKTPNLRFLGFKGEWEEKSFKEIVKINQGLQIAISERFLKPSEDSQFYITNEFLNPKSDKRFYIKNPSKSVICNEDDILMTRTGNTGKVVTNVKGAFHNNFFRIAYPDYIDKKYLYYFLILPKTQNIILRLAGTSTIPDLNHSDFYKIKFIYPNLTEQKKVSGFLAKIDEIISTQNEIIDNLESLMKGFGQKIFSQEIKFKTNEGFAFPNWEKKRLGVVLSYEQPTKYIVNSTEYNDSFKTPVLTAGQTFILGYTDEIKNIFTKYPVIIFDDFTMATQFVDFPFKVKSSAMKILKNDNKISNIKFIYAAIQMINYPKGDEHKRFWISEYSKIKIPFPILEEQNKIADFLSKIDNKIQVEKQLLDSLINQKKYFLQQLFI